MPKKESKDKVYNNIQAHLGNFKTVFLCDIKDMPANNIHKMRHQLRSVKSEVLCGKSVSLII